MAKQHTVQPGDCISSIAEQFGLFPDTIWDHPANGDLKLKRKDPNTLCEGDVVVVPDPRERKEKVDTGALHRFQVRNTPAIFRLQVFDDDEPRANQEYELYLDDQPLKGTTDAQGNLEHPMPPKTKKAKLIIGEDRAEFTFVLGHLEPPSEVRGLQARLTNLGFACKPTGSMDQETKDALKEFQQFAGIPVTGEYDETTRARLEALHDEICLLEEEESEGAEDDEDQGDDTGPEDAEE